MRLLPLAVAFGVGCGGVPATLTELEQTIFVPSCAFAMCHAAVGASNGLDLERVGSWARLVNAESTVGKKLVVPGDPAASYLYEKLTSVPFTGVAMPPNAPLQTDQINKIGSWILAGAPNN